MRPRTTSQGRRRPVARALRRDGAMPVRVRLAVVGIAVALTLACLAGALSAQGPEGLTGTVVVANKSANTASFIDVATASVVGSVPTGNNPHELLVTGDGRTAVITDYGSGGRGGGNSTLTVLDIASRGVRSTIDLGSYSAPHGLDFLPGDSLVAVTSESTGNVVIVRLATGETVRAVPTGAQGSHMVAVTGDGARMYTGNIGSSSVSELDPVTGERTRVFATPPSPEAINVTPDGGRVFVGSNDEGLVSVIDTETGQLSTVAEGLSWPYRIFPTPGVEQIIVPDYRGETLRFLDGTTYEERGRIAFPGEGPQGLTLHPDGVHLFLSLAQAGRIAVVDIRTREIVGYLPSGPAPDGIGYSGLEGGRH